MQLVRLFIISEKRLCCIDKCFICKALSIIKNGNREHIFRYMTLRYNGLFCIPHSIGDQIFVDLHDKLCINGNHHIVQSAVDPELLTAYQSACFSQHCN